MTSKELFTAIGMLEEDVLQSCLIESPSSKYKFHFLSRVAAVILVLFVAVFFLRQNKSVPIQPTTKQTVEPMVLELLKKNILPDLT